METCCVRIFRIVDKTAYVVTLKLYVTFALLLILCHVCVAVNLF